jgi:hypothetical protein
MTLPDERYRAVIQTAKFLQALSYSSETKRIPLAIRKEARRLLRHYPTEWDMDRASNSVPDIFQQQMEDVTRMFKYWDQKKAEENDQT